MNHAGEQMDANYEQGIEASCGCGQDGCAARTEIIFSIA